MGGEQTTRRCLWVTYIYHCMFAGMSIFRKDHGIFMDRENQSSDIGAVDLQACRGLEETIG